MADAPTSAPVDPRLIQWLAVQALHDRDARLVDGGSDPNERIELARLFIDLPVALSSKRRRVPREGQTCMHALLHSFGREEEGPRALLIGGPGSGKSTLTTMLAQVLRMPWLDAQEGDLPATLRKHWQQAKVGLAALSSRLEWPAVDRVLPLRVNLPSFARWMGSQHGEGEPLLWQHLAARAAEELAAHNLSWEVTAANLRQAARGAGLILWILDGLDEVPHTAGRAEVVAAVSAVVCERDVKSAGLVVATRPQGYEGEFDELDPMTLLPLPSELARDYGERLIGAWAQRAAAMDVNERLAALRNEFAKPEVEALLQTPLHTTIAAVLVAGRGTLPKSRYQLFKEYFRTVLQREMRKSFGHQVTDEDEGVLRALHAQAGLLLHVRAQAKQGARSSLRRRELAELLGAIYGGLQYEGEERRAHVERILRFAAERLVLLIHDVQGEYSFGVRSLQEFFAAEALMEGETDDVAKRLDAVLCSPHWSNVVAFVVSAHALATTPSARATALRLTSERCSALNRGNGGEAAARCLLGSHLALAMLREVQRYAGPWLLDELWRVACEAATISSQDGAAHAVELERRAQRRGRETWWDAEEIHVRLGMVAARQEGSSGKRWRGQLYDAANALFSQGAEAALVAWRLLNGLLVSGDPEAEVLAHQHAPATSADAWLAFEAGTHGGDYVISAWWCEYLRDHPLWFTPGKLAQRLLDPDHQRPVPALDVVSRLLVDPPSFGICVENFHTALYWISCNHRPSLPQELPNGSVAWDVWHRVAAFFVCSSHDTLAEVVELLVHPDALQEMWSCVSGLPWPLAACVEFVASRGHASELASLLRNRALGDVDEWQAAERRLSIERTAPHEDWEALWTAVQPWPKNIGTKGLPIPTSFGDYTDGEDIVRWIEEARPSLGPIWLTVVRSVTSLHGSPSFHKFVDGIFASAAVPSRLRMHFPVLLDLEGTVPSEWIAYLDERARSPEATPVRLFIARGTEALRSLLHHLREQPQRWGLLDTIVNLLRALPAVAPAERILPSVPIDAPPRAHAQHALITLCSGHFPPSERTALLARLIWDDDTHHDLRTQLASVLDSRGADQDPSTELLLAALDASPAPTSEAHDALLGALFSHARRLTPPAFASSDAWLSDHHLPPPFLSGQAPPHVPPVLISLDALKNIRLFADTPAVDAPFPRPSSDRGQWLVLVGENGVGKTTLLRAFALTLAPPAVASKLLDERLPFVRNGEAARVAVTLDTGRREITLRREERTEVIEPVATPDGEPPWVVAYGVRRGNALGEKDRPPELGPVGDLHTLFERPAALYPAAQWLRDLDGDVLREQRRSPRKEGAPPGPREATWQAAVKALQTILGVTVVEVEERGAVYVTHPEFGRVPFEAMSDGYLGTAGWLIDMIARWIDRQQELDEPIGPNVLRQMCGLALVDEVDLHLHPVWQLRIIDDVRRLFPRMSFIVTTHNPLALHGARAGEIFVMRREGAKVELVQRDIRPGQDVDRVLFEQFGVKHTLDRETRELLDQHRQMVERRVPPDDAERRRLEARLVERFGDVGAAVRDERAAEDGSPLRPDEQHLVDELLKGA